MTLWPGLVDHSQKGGSLLTAHCPEACLRLRPGAEEQKPREMVQFPEKNKPLSSCELLTWPPSPLLVLCGLLGPHPSPLYSKADLAFIFSFFPHLSLSFFFFFLFLSSFITFFEQQRGRGAQRSCIYLFSSHLTTPAEARSLELHHGLPHVWQEPKGSGLHPDLHSCGMPACQPVGGHS